LPHEHVIDPTRIHHSWDTGLEPALRIESEDTVRYDLPRADMAKPRFADPTAQSGPPKPLTDFQTGFYDMARRLREAGLPGAHP
jgi:hypothetical protein